MNSSNEKTPALVAQSEGQKNLVGAGSRLRSVPTPARVVTRTTGVLVIDVSRQQQRGWLMPDPRFLNLPACGAFPPGTNVRLLIGDTHDVLGDHYGMAQLSQALRGCVVVVEGTDLHGIHAVQAAVEASRGLPYDAIRLGCQDGGCDLLYGAGG